MNEHAYASLNKRVQAAWATVAPETLPPAAGPPAARFPFVVGQPAGTLPAECCRIWWFTYGTPSPLVPGELVARLQLDLYVGHGDRLLALRKADALDAALGVTPNAAFVPFDLVNYTAAPPRTIGRMRLIVPGSGWVDVPDPNASTVHLARRFEVAWAQ